MSDLELKCVNTIRAVSADQPQAANSGHPGAPMGCAPMAFLLWTEFMNYSSKDAKWIARDRFVLSNGHACALQYTMLHLTGYKIGVEDLKKFRQLGSITPGHPESFLTDGVEVCTGPLGQGICNAVGMAIAERHLAATFNTDDHKIFDNFTYVICGDGCLQEGVSGEACSLAGHLGLGKMIVLYDDNDITIDGPTSHSFSEDVNKRYEAYGWHVQTVDDVSKDLGDLRAAIKAAQAETNKPSIIKIKTAIGYGSPSKQGSEKAHGAPLGAEDLAGAKKFFGLPEDKSFFVPEDVQKFFTKAAEKADKKRVEWDANFAKYTAANPEKAAELSRRIAHKMPDGVFDKLPSFTIGKDKDLASRKHSENCLNAMCPLLPEMVGGSADLTPSNNTRFKGASDFQKATPEGRYLRFGVREHGMAAVCNGIFAYGALRPFCATFLTFVGYCVGAIRLSALSKSGVIYIMTHDSIGLGEDGPTHQPIETMESLRCMPNIMVFRPADSNEMAAAYKVALSKSTTPSVICASRQTLKSLKLSTIEKASTGAYVAVEAKDPKLVLVATGSEVGICVEAAAKLTADGVPTQVVTMPCQELFLEQTQEYQKSVLPGNVPTLSVEAASPSGWHRFSHAQIAMNSFGASGPGGEVMAHFGFTTDNVVEKGKALTDFYKDGTVPDLSNRPVFETVGGH
ncbi:Transketolase 1 [Seminavis robusta]|uniref:transketolase n=1 Tax=Seminavis robusta TaxID=568900 RepID=A0A9N8E3T0_9STRA|nr:Transketolase 1 [Seminavis robusta]|eukprot:Sro524_g159900.1 Transketolase 1 (682) ;mRNA; r:9246-11762